MDFGAIINSLPLMKIMQTLRDNNETSSPQLQTHLNVSRGKIIELTDRLLESGYISKSKRLIDRDLVTCYTLTTKGLQEFQAYEMKIKDHIGTEDFDYLPYHEMLSLVLDEDTVVKHFFKN